MKTIVFLGDSITFASRSPYEGALGSGYVFMSACELAGRYPAEYRCVNSGENGHRIVDLYARIKRDVWNHNPDYISVLCGANDVGADKYWCNGVDDERFEECYRRLITDSIKQLPDVKFILVEPYHTDTEFVDGVKAKASIVERIATDMGIPYVKIADKIRDAIEKYPSAMVLRDTIHPAAMGARIIAEEWLKVFEENYVK